MRIRDIFVAAFALALSTAPADSAVMLTFMSRDSSPGSYPHAFVRVTGSTNAKPLVPLDTNYGFTAVVAGIGVLMGPVNGEVIAVKDNYVAKSDGHFALMLNDQQYAQVLALVDEWKHLPGKSYDLHKRNCVHFVKAIAQLEGLRVDHVDQYMLKPRSFLDEVANENTGRIINIPGYRPKGRLRP